MKLRNDGAEFFIPDNTQIDKAIARTTHMAISAHQDDIEFMAHDGILKCFGKADKWFYSVVATNGAGSPRDDLYAAYTDDEMQKVRKLEQKKAAFVGEYGAVTLLDYSSSEVKDPKNTDVVSELKELICAARPNVIYTHNLADKHDTHIGVVTKVIRALRELPKDVHPEKLYGCEVWRSLDWVNDEEKIAFDVSAHPNIAAAVVGVFDSQICGGKRYDLATTGRRLANATYFVSHGTDKASSLMYAMDLTPLIKNTDLDIKDYIFGYIDRFKLDVENKLSKLL
ncbi:MAG: PIG-L deacetylase family protein, partial [Ruminiclostridium sp.]